MRGLEGKRAIVTGGSGSMGSVTAVPGGGMVIPCWRNASAIGVSSGCLVLAILKILQQFVKVLETHD